MDLSGSGYCPVADCGEHGGGGGLQVAVLAALNWEAMNTASSSSSAALGILYVLKYTLLVIIVTGMTEDFLSPFSCHSLCPVLVWRFGLWRLRAHWCFDGTMLLWEAPDTKLWQGLGCFEIKTMAYSMETAMVTDWFCQCLGVRNISSQTRAEVKWPVILASYYRRSGGSGQYRRIARPYILTLFRHVSKIAESGY